MSRRTGATALVTALVLTGVAGCSDGDGASDSGPVATDDDVVLYAGERADLDPLANDTGPGIRVCKLPPSGSGRLHYEYSDVAERLNLSAMPRTRAGEHRIGYAACAGDERATATVHVTVLARPAVTVTKTSRPGRLRVTNPADVPIQFEYGHPNEELLSHDDRFRVPAGGDAGVPRAPGHDRLERWLPV